MALSVGAHLGSYEILGPLGAGGMGEAEVQVVLNWAEELKKQVPHTK